MELAVVYLGPRGVRNQGFTRVCHGGQSHLSIRGKQDMRSLRCKCGQTTASSSMSVPRCIVCENCGTTLAGSPSAHETPAPHEWEERWRIDAKTGERSQERVCINCALTVRIDPQPDSASPRIEDLSQ